jgi:hypothetical protein
MKTARIKSTNRASRQLSPALGTGSQGPETGSQNRRYRDLSWRERPHVPHLNPRKRPQIAGYSSETGKHRFASDCVVGPGVVTHANLVNGLRVKQLQKGPLNANGFLSKCQNWSDTFVGGRGQAKRFCRLAGGRRL